MNGLGMNNLVIFLISGIGSLFIILIAIYLAAKPIIKFMQKHRSSPWINNPLARFAEKMTFR